jgi:hypothetical protein
MLPRRRAPQPGSAPRLWRDNRLFVVRTYDPHQFDEVEARRLEAARPGVWSVYWRPKGLTQTAYDTLDAVNALGWANDSGMCISCGGVRRNAQCSCPDHKTGRRESVGGPARKRSGAGSTGSPVPAIPALPPTPRLDLTEAVLRSAEAWEAESPASTGV